jgi:hypothetical protein
MPTRSWSTAGCRARSRLNGASSTLAPERLSRPQGLAIARWRLPLRRLVRHVAEKGGLSQSPTGARGPPQRVTSCGRRRFLGWPLSGHVSGDPAGHRCQEAGARRALADTAAVWQRIQQSEAALQLAAALAGERDARLIGVCIINVLKMDLGMLPGSTTLASSAELPEPRSHG